ncbi:MAG TPA: DUF3644 domain-containing protein [Clostridiales bacterium]|nr:DUF3644 domain-containing protein [Clostridiales bacterium]
MARKKVQSIKRELVKKSKESALTAIQVYNNPNIQFKSETYIVLMIIAWTYMLHAFFRNKEIDYRYFQLSRNRKKKVYDKTKNGAYKYWELERCLNDYNSPIDRNTTNNLKFLIGLRHEIEHQMTKRIDDLLSARFQSCALNYNEYIKKLFGVEHSIEDNLSFSLQFSTITDKQKDILMEYKDLPANIHSYVVSYDSQLTEEEYNNPHFAYRVIFTPKLVNHRGQADKVIEFIKPETELAKGISQQYYVLKESEKKKYLPTQIVDEMQKNYPKFNIHHFIKLWQSKDAKNPKYNYGTMVANKYWHWYANWVEEVRLHCENNKHYYL